MVSFTGLPIYSAEKRLDALVEAAPFFPEKIQKMIHSLDLDFRSYTNIKNRTVWSKCSDAPSLQILCSSISVLYKHIFLDRGLLETVARTSSDLVEIPSSISTEDIILTAKIRSLNPRTLPIFMSVISFFAGEKVVDLAYFADKMVSSKKKNEWTTLLWVSLKMTHKIHMEKISCETFHSEIDYICRDLLQLKEVSYREIDNGCYEIIGEIFRIGTANVVEQFSSCVGTKELSGEMRREILSAISKGENVDGEIERVALSHYGDRDLYQRHSLKTITLLLSLFRKLAAASEDCTSPEFEHLFHLLSECDHLEDVLTLFSSSMQRKPSIALLTFLAELALEIEEEEVRRLLTFRGTFSELAMLRFERLSSLRVVEKNRFALLFFEHILRCKTATFFAALCEYGEMLRDPTHWKEVAKTSLKFLGKKEEEMIFVFFTLAPFIPENRLALFQTICSCPGKKKHLRIGDVLFEKMAKGCKVLRREVKERIESIFMRCPDNIAASNFAYHFLKHRTTLMLPDDDLLQLQAHTIREWADSVSIETPYALYRRHIEWKETLFPLYPIPLKESGYTVDFSAVKKVKKEEISRGEIPPGVHSKTLERLFSKFERKFREMSAIDAEALKASIIAMTGMTFNALKDNLCEDAEIQRLLHLPSLTDEKIEIHTYELYSLLSYAVALDNEILDESGLSRQENFLLLLSCSIQECAKGKRAGIHHAYEAICESGWIGRRNVDEETPERQVESWLRGVVLNNIEKKLTEEGPFFYEATGGISGGQRVHQTIYMKNIFAKLFANEIEFDISTEMVSRPLLEKNPRQLFELLAGSISVEELAHEIKRSYDSGTIEYTALIEAYGGDPEDLFTLTEYYPGDEAYEAMRITNRVAEGDYVSLYSMKASAPLALLERIEFVLSI